MGSGFDIVSGGELHHLQRIGVRGDRIVFSGVGKDRHEIREALNYRVRGQGGRSGILLFNAESEAELDILMEESARLQDESGKSTCSCDSGESRCASRRSPTYRNRASRAQVWPGVV